MGGEQAPLAENMREFILKEAGDTRGPASGGPRAAQEAAPFGGRGAGVAS